MTFGLKWVVIAGLTAALFAALSMTASILAGSLARVFRLSF